MPPFPAGLGGLGLAIGSGPFKKRRFLAICRNKKRITMLNTEKEKEKEEIITCRNCGGQFPRKVYKKRVTCPFCGQVMIIPSLKLREIITK